MTLRPSSEKSSLEHADFAGRRRSLGVTRGGHEVERDPGFARDVADEVGQEDERALEHSDQVHIVWEVASNFGGHLGDRA